MREISEVRCPRCGGPITYNGNYYCQRWGWRAIAPECNWALPHPQKSYADRLTSWQLTGAWEDRDVMVRTKPTPERVR